MKIEEISGDEKIKFSSVKVKNENEVFTYFLIG